MADKDSRTPRVYLARHGETEWTKSGRYTGKTDLALTTYGEKQVLGTGLMLVGNNKLIAPSRLIHVFTSPRRRAQQTFNHLFNNDEKLALLSSISTTEELAEWDYGDYEGLLTAEIRARRKARGLDGERKWDIWRDGCESGESAQQVTERLDQLIVKIKELQAPNMNGQKPGDVLLVAHGHILRAFTKRWLKYPMEFPLSMMIEPGGIGILSYQHHNIDEPAFLLGMGFPLPAAES